MYGELRARQPNFHILYKNLAQKLHSSHIVEFPRVKLWLIIATDGIIHVIIIHVSGSGGSRGSLYAFASAQTRWVAGNMQIGAAARCEHDLGAHLTLIIVDRAAIINRRSAARERPEGDLALRCPIKRRVVVPNLRTATYNDRGPRPRKFGGTPRWPHERGPGCMYLGITSVYLRLHLPAFASPPNLTAHQFVI